MGLQVNDLSGDGSRAALSLRGFGNNAFANTLVLIDGISWAVPDVADLSNIDLGIFPMEQIKKIEILPSSDSVKA